MKKKVNKDKRDTIAAYLLFIFGCMLMPLLLISFQSAAYGVNLIPLMTFVFISSLVTSMLFYNLKVQVHFRTRFIIYWILITSINLFLWLVICDGTFIFKD